MAECPVEFEVITFKMLDKTAAKYDLEHISAKAVGNAFSDIGLMFFVGERAGGFANGMEVVCREVVVADYPFQFVELIRFTVFDQFDEGERIVKVVEHHDIFVENVQQVGGIILFLRAVLDVNRFEIAYGIE